MDELLEELKVKLIQVLALPDVKAEDVKPDEPLIGAGLGLDSIDVLELVVMLEEDYGVKIADKELGKKVFASLRSLAEYVHEHRAK
jgi:acyl carrier protein